MKMSRLRALPVVGYGIFTLAVQTLLFREFLTSFEGNDISVGRFFGSWFLWIAAAAGIARRGGTPLADRLLRRLDYLLLGYLPAVLLQWFLIVQARALVGAPAFLLLPLRTVIPLALVVNAPVGLVTGLLFPLVCRWVREGGARAPVAQVYRLEALGSLVGGAGATLLLGIGWSPLRLLLLLAAVIALAAAVVRRTRTQSWRWLLLPGLLLAALVAGADRPATRRLQQLKWERLLPGTAFGGSFQTPQGEYLYGNLEGQWVVLRDGSTCEALPGGEGDARTAALALCQQPQAADILVIGSGLGLCQAFLSLDSVRQVTWAQGDGDYMRRVIQLIPPGLRIDDHRLRRLEGDVRTRLAQEGERYDLVIINLPEATRAALNRFHTLEAYRLVRRALRPGGVLAAAVGGGANRMGEERLLLGASMRATLLQVFPEVVLAPGEGSWLLAAAPGILSGDPDVLQARLESLPGAAQLFPPAGLHTVYPQARAAAALERYAQAPLPPRLLINRDTRPLATLYSLLLAARQAGARGTAYLAQLARSGPLVPLAPLLALVLLRLLAVATTRRTARNAASAATWLTATSGAAGIGISILLMHVYQTRHGSLYLHVGLLSALYMAGLAAGAAGFAALLARRPAPDSAGSSAPAARQTTVLQGVLILAHTALLAAIGYWPEHAWHHVAFGVAFLLGGLCAGGYFPLAAARMTEAGIEAGRAGARLETADHLGATAGSLLTGLLMLPLLGNRLTLLALALLLLANLPVPVLRRPAAEAAAPSWPVVWLRRIGYLLAGVGVTLLIGHRHWAGPLPAVPSAPPSDAVTVTVPPADPTPVPSPAPAAAQEAPAATEPGAADETPEEDTSLLRALIRAGRLSDHEADFYHQVTEDD